MASETTSTHGHNYLSDWTAEEKTRLRGLKNVARNEEDRSTEVFTAPEGLTLPTSVDWVTVTPAVVNPVKDQGQCGSCWAFSSTGALEGAHQIATGELLSFSEQQLVDCVKTSYGCNGGW